MDILRPWLENLKTLLIILVGIFPTRISFLELCDITDKDVLTILVSSPPTVVSLSSSLLDQFDGR